MLYKEFPFFLSLQSLNQIIPLRIVVSTSPPLQAVHEMAGIRSRISSWVFFIFA